MHKIKKRLPFSFFLLVFIMCSSGSSTGTNISLLHTTHYAQIGSIKGATAECFKKNGNEQNVPSSLRNQYQLLMTASTDSSGKFNFKTPCPSTGFIKVSGGVDVSTGMAAPTLYASPTSKYITPVTQLAFLVEKGYVQKKDVDENLLNSSHTTNHLDSKTGQVGQKLAQLSALLDIYTRAIILNTKKYNSENRINNNSDTYLTAMIKAAYYVKPTSNYKITNLADNLLQPGNIPIKYKLKTTPEIDKTFADHDFLTQAFSSFVGKTSLEIQTALNTTNGFSGLIASSTALSNSSLKTDFFDKFNTVHEKMFYMYMQPASGGGSPTITLGMYAKFFKTLPINAVITCKAFPIATTTVTRNNFSSG